MLEVWNEQYTLKLTQKFHFVLSENEKKSLVFCFFLLKYKFKALDLPAAKKERSGLLTKGSLAYISAFCEDVDPLYVYYKM